MRAFCAKGATPVKRRDREPCLGLACEPPRPERTSAVTPTQTRSRIDWVGANCRLLRGIGQTFLTKDVSLAEVSAFLADELGG